MTIAEAAAHFNVSDKTIRRWIQSKRIDAHKNGDGKWAIAVETSPPDNDQDSVQSQESPMIAQLQSENAHLRDQLSRKDDQLSSKDTQIDQLNQILAMTSAQNAELTRQLPATERIAKALEDPAPKQPILSRLKTLFGLQT